MTAVAQQPKAPGHSFYELVWPKEHGSWSLAFEPLALGLLCAPSLGGAFLSIAIGVGFFCRRPMRIALLDPRARRRVAAQRILIIGMGVATLAIAGAVFVAGAQWLVWLTPAIILGGVFATYDSRNGGREEIAELVGSAAFAVLPGAFAVLGVASPAQALTLAALMVGRAVPTVIFVRIAVRGRKTGQTDFRLAYVAAGAALVVALALARRGLAPTASAACFVFFLGRIAFVAHQRAMRAKQIGIFETIAGVGFIVVTAAAW